MVTTKVRLYLINTYKPSTLYFVFLINCDDPHATIRDYSVKPSFLI